MTSKATSSAAGVASKRVAIVAPSAWSVIALRADLVRRIVAGGHRILCFVPGATGAEERALRGLGVDWQVYDEPPAGLGILAFGRAVKRLAASLSDWRPHVVLGFGARAMPLAALAARKAGAGRVVSLCTGLPAGDLRLDPAGVGPRRLKAALRASDALVVHNSDDAKRLAALGLLPAGLPVATVPGAGVDLAVHVEQPLPPVGPDLTFLMIAPLDKERGVMDYVKAAQEVKSRRPGARFLLAGPADRSREPVAREQLTKSSAVIVLEPVDDVRPLLAGCHVFVYPSHAEGMPRVVLEALAAGRPVITTRASGCRETVDEHVNGWLVPPGDWRGLAVAMEGYLRRPELLTSAARASRTKAERQFGLERSVAGLLEAMELS